MMPTLQQPWLMLGDCLERMREIPDDSIDLTVTSPPYDGLRKYNGYSFDFQGVPRELYRVTKPGGVVVWVVGDATMKGSETGTSFRQALYFKDACGFNLHNTMIYHKESQPRQSVRYEQHFEYMFVFSKGAVTTFNPLQIPCKQAGRVASRTCRDSGKDVLRKSFYTTAQTKKRGNVWTYETGKDKSTKDRFAFAHPAIFPEGLAADHISSWSNPGDIVLDPFFGSGTTGKMAVLTGRAFIGIELSDQYLSIGRRRIKAAIAAANQPALSGGLFSAVQEAAE